MKLLFKQRIQPRDIEATSDLQILCCSVGPMISKFNYKHNHYALKSSKKAAVRTHVQNEVFPEARMTPSELELTMLKVYLGHLI